MYRLSKPNRFLTPGERRPPGNRHLVVAKSQIGRIFNALALISCLLAPVSIVSFPEGLAAQQPEASERYLEDYESNSLTDTEFSQILQDLSDHPINLNRASLNELLSIPFLYHEAAIGILHFRQRHGRFASKADLLKVPEISAELFEQISPFLSVETRPPPDRIDFRVQLGEALHRIQGFEEGSYSSPLDYFQKLRWQPTPVFRASLVWEKDPGELQVFDFGSFSMRYRWEQLHSDLIGGDFNFLFGQKLVFGNTYGDPLTVAPPLSFWRNAFSVREKFSLNEAAFLRGAAWSTGPFSSWKIVAGFSRRSLDATRSDDGTFVQSISVTGLHRTAAELARRAILSESAVFGSITKQSGANSVGLLVARVSYSLPVDVRRDPPVSEFNYVSVTHSFGLGHLSYEGESALRDLKIPALQHSLFLKTGPIVYGLMAYYYHPDYWAFHGRAFGEIASSPQNQLGGYINIRAVLGRGWKTAAYLHLERKARTEDAFDFVNKTRQVQVEKIFSGNLLRMRWTRKVRPPAAGSQSNQLTLDNLRLDFRSRVSNHVKLGQRLEASRAGPRTAAERSFGFSYYSDLRLFWKTGFSLQFRWTHFDVPGFDYRIYEFEPDLPGNFQIDLLDDRGYKWFVRLEWRGWKALRLNLKFKEIYFPDRTTLGSGKETILGNAKRAVRMQLQIIL